MPEIENHLGTLRQKRGISAAQLARTVGVTRQTIYAMEAGSYVPTRRWRCGWRKLSK
jgi:putative molybdopterin biosynthesis protein